jgi:hypothetical protein
MHGEPEVARLIALGRITQASSESHSGGLGDIT